MIESAKLAGLLQGPLVWLPATLAIYAAATALWRRHGKAPILNPTMLSIIAIGAVLLLSGVSYPAYLDGVVILNYVLGTAVVALAVPLHRHIHLLQGRTLKLAAALFVGSTTSLVLGLIVAKAAGASLETILSIAPKAATTAVSIEIARGIGGLPGLTAVVTIMTGITTAVVGPYVLDLLGVRAPETRGLALGVSGHGIATARAFSESEAAGSFASIGTALNASLTAALVPLAVWALGLM
jgi:putative effector of murein hydrolase